MVKVQKLPNGQLVITIPKLLAEYKGLKRGTELIVSDFEKDSFILKIVKSAKKVGRKKK